MPQKFSSPIQQWRLCLCARLIQSAIRQELLLNCFMRHIKKTSRRIYQSRTLPLSYHSPIAQSFSLSRKHSGSCPLSQVQKCSSAESSKVPHNMNPSMYFYTTALLLYGTMALKSPISYHVWVSDFFSPQSFEMFLPIPSTQDQNLEALSSWDLTGLAKCFCSTL